MEATRSALTIVYLVSALVGASVQFAHGLCPACAEKADGPDLNADATNGQTEG